MLAHERACCAEIAPMFYYRPIVQAETSLSRTNGGERRRRMPENSPHFARAAAAPAPPRAISDHEIMGGFAKGLSVIEAFGRDREALTIADVARLAGLDRAVARRCLLTLVKLGYAESVGREFSLTARVLGLGYAYLSAAPLPRLIQ